jgi:hypothetical protein
MTQNSLFSFHFFRKIVIILVLAFSFYLIIHGIQLDDIAEIISNGSILCLSCIGIG